MSERANCEDCVYRSDINSDVRARVASELGITCSGRERGDTTVSVSSGGAPGLAMEMKLTPLNCPLVTELNRHLIRESVHANPRPKLLDLILRDRISMQLPLEEAIQTVAEKQTSGKFSHFSEFTCDSDVDVARILQSIEIVTVEENVTVQNRINGLGETIEPLAVI